MDNSLHIISEEVVKNLTASLVFSCQNILIYKYESSINFYDHKDISNDIYNFVVENLTTLPNVFKYDDDKKFKIIEDILNKKFEYSKVIFDYYITYFNLEFIKKVFYSDEYTNQLEKNLKNKIIDINKHIRTNSKNEFIDYLPYLLSQIDVDDFNKIASTISHEFDRFSFEQIKDIFDYNKAYYTQDKLETLYTNFIGEKFNLPIIFETKKIKVPDSNKKFVKILDDTEKEVMDVISDLTLLYECLNDLNILVTFVTDEAILFDEQLIIKDIYYTFKDVIKNDDYIFVEELFALLEQATENIIDESSNNTDEILEIVKNEENLDETTKKLLYMLNVLEEMYAEDVFDFFVSEYFFDKTIG